MVNWSFDEELVWYLCMHFLNTAYWSTAAEHMQDVATTEIAWQQCTQEMIMAVACDTSRLYARVGNSLCAWYHESGQERWQRHEPLG